jgi:hypothetical protein
MVIYDENLVLQHYQILNKLVKDQVLMIFGGARKKYDKTLSTSHEIVTRQLVKYNNPIDFLQAVKKTDALLNVSIDKRTNKKLSAKSHVIYMGVNPRSAINAMMSTNTKMLKYLTNTILYNGNEQDSINNIKNFNTHFFSEIQKNPANKANRVLDIDIKNPEIPQMILDYKSIIPYIEYITETNGGYHVVYNRKANQYFYGKNGGLIKEIVSKFNLKYTEKEKDIEMFEDRLTPIWGTTQGDFKVKPFYIKPISFIKLSKLTPEEFSKFKKQWDEILKSSTNEKVKILELEKNE